MNLSSTDILIIAVLVGIIILLVGIIIILDIITKRKNQEELEKTNESLGLDVVEDEPVTNLEQVQVSEELPIEINNEPTTHNRVEEIKYVEEDKELEKTKAKLELQELQKELERQEKLNIQNELAKSVQEEVFKKKEETDHLVESVVNYQEEPQVEPVLDNISVPPVVNEVIETPVEEVKPEVGEEQVAVVEEVKPEVVEEPVSVVEETKLEVEPVVESSTTVEEITSKISNDLKEEKVINANLPKALEVQEDLNELLNNGLNSEIEEHEDQQEKSAIISVEELTKLSDKVYDINEEYQMSYEDEGNELISIKELEKLYNKDLKQVVEQIKEEPVIIDEANFKKMEDLPPISMDKKFKSSPFISPVFGVSETKESLELEQTANLDKLNEEIKKTNEFLVKLKELKNNLD